MRHPAVVALLAPALAVAGCRGTHTARAVAPVSTASVAQWDPTKMPDPCRLISRSEVAATIGAPVSPGTRLQTWPPLCRFVIDPASATFVYLSDDSRPAAVDDFDRNAHTTNETQPVTGVGDRAYWLPQLGALHVLRAGTQVVVMFRGGKVPTDARTAAVGLARIALPRARP